MTALYHSPFLIALGWTIAASLWQTALLWLLYQLVSNIFLKNNPALKHTAAVFLLFASFTWFGVTFVQHYTDITGLSKSLAELSAKDSNAAQTLLEITAANYPDTRILDTLNVYLPYFSTAYLIVLLVLSIKLCNAYVYSRQLRTKGLIEVEKHWENFVVRYAKQIGIARQVKIYFSEYIDVPATLDFLKPVILLPVAAFNHLTTQQVESILLHELAHIKRNDYLINIIVSVVETILFFNPFVHLLGKSIKKEREHCCDDLVLHYKFDPHSYASALLSLEKMRIGFQPLAVAATGNNNQLLGRVKRIMNVKSTQFNYGQKLLALAVIAFMLISIAWLSPSSNKETAGNKLPEKNKSSQLINNQQQAVPELSLSANINIKPSSKPSPSASLKTTQSDERSLITSSDNLDTFFTASPLTPPVIFPTNPQVPLPPVPPVTGLTISQDLHIPDHPFADAPFFEPNNEGYNLYAPPTFDMNVVPDEWAIKDDGGGTISLGALKLFEDALKSMNPGETKKIIHLFQQAQLEAQNKQVELEALLPKNLNKLLDPQKKFAQNTEVFKQKVQKQKISFDSIQNMNRLLLKKMNYTLRQKINFDSIQKMKRLLLKNEDDHRAIWISNDGINKEEGLQNITTTLNGNINSGVTFVANITRAGCDNIIQPKLAVAKEPVRVTPAAKKIITQEAYTMDYDSGSSSSSSVSTTKKDTRSKKLVINNEENGNTLIITIEL